MALAGVAGRVLGNAAKTGGGGIGGTFKAIGTKSLLPSAVGALAVSEFIKQAAILPGLQRAGIGVKPSAVAPLPPPTTAPRTIQEYVMYGEPSSNGFFGIGAKERRPGLIERRFEADNQYRNMALTETLKTGLESQRIGVGGDVERQRLISNSQNVIAGLQAGRDIESARQNTYGNYAANMAIMVAGTGLNAPVNYGASMVASSTNIAPLNPPMAMQMRSPMNNSPGAPGTGFRRGAGRRGMRAGMGAGAGMAGQAQTLGGMAGGAY
jgi:hypothetical protein